MSPLIIDMSRRDREIYVSIGETKLRVDQHFSTIRICQMCQRTYEHVRFFLTNIFLSNIIFQILFQFSFSKCFSIFFSKFFFQFYFQTFFLSTFIFKKILIQNLKETFKLKWKESTNLFQMKKICSNYLLIFFIFLSAF